jgi:hypothetical protein
MQPGGQGGCSRRPELPDGGAGLPGRVHAPYSRQGCRGKRGRGKGCSSHWDRKNSCWACHSLFLKRTANRSARERGHTRQHPLQHPLRSLKASAKYSQGLRPVKMVFGKKLLYPTADTRFLPGPSRALPYCIRDKVRSATDTSYIFSSALGRASICREKRWRILRKFLRENAIYSHSHT